MAFCIFLGVACVTGCLGRLKDYKRPSTNNQSLRSTGIDKTVFHLRFNSNNIHTRYLAHLVNISNLKNGCNAGFYFQVAAALTSCAGSGQVF